MSHFPILATQVKKRKSRLDLLIVRGRHLRKTSDRTATELTYAEVISYNRKNFKRELQNENQQHNRIAEYIPLLSFEELKELEAEVMQLA